MTLCSGHSNTPHARVALLPLVENRQWHARVKLDESARSIDEVNIFLGIEKVKINGSPINAIQQRDNVVYH